MIYFIGAVLGYLFGCFSPASIIAKIKNVDIRHIGSKNPGASNVFITIGVSYGVLVGVLDILKSFIPSAVIYLVSDGNLNAAVLAGAFAIVGHCLPFWLKFDGGKGFAPFMGLILFYDWKMFLIFVAAVILIILITDFISVATFTLSLFMPFYVYFVAEEKTAAAIFLFVTVLIWTRHRQNIKNLISGTEIGFMRKNKFTKKEP